MPEINIKNLQIEQITIPKNIGKTVDGVQAKTPEMTRLAIYEQSSAADNKIQPIETIAIRSFLSLPDWNWLRSAVTNLFTCSVPCYAKIYKIK